MTARWLYAPAVGAAVLTVACASSGLQPPEPDSVLCGSRILSPVPTEATFAPGEVIVGFQEGTSEAEALAYLERLGLPVDSPSGWDDEAGRRYVRACVRPGDEHEWVEWLQSEGAPVEYAHKNSIGRLHSAGAP